MKRFPQREDEIRLALIRLLETENRKEHAAAGGSLSEGYLEYLGLLTGLVANLRDRRAINALMDALPHGDGAAITVSRMLDPTQQPPLGAVSRARVKSALVKQTKDSYYVSRISAVQGLAKFPGDDVTAILESIASGDRRC